MKTHIIIMAALAAVWLATLPVMAQENTAGIDLTRLPIGDGNISDGPVVGNVWLCDLGPGGGGAFADGPWIHADGTFDLTTKAIVDGAITWPATFEIVLAGESRRIVGNGLPDHPTGVYPIASTDDAYQYDRNPNRIAAQTVALELAANPVVAGEAACVPMGAVGVWLSGSVIFNALDAQGRDAVAHETLDGCQGHPERDGNYHNHSLSSCLSDEDHSSGHSGLMGYVFDGFGIYGYQGEAGAGLSSADLDACHGHNHTLEWDGQIVALYHYHATYDYPYTVGCYQGTSSVLSNTGGGQPSQGGPDGGQPPQGGPPPRQGSGGGQPPRPPGNGG